MFVPKFSRSVDVIVTPKYIARGFYNNGVLYLSGEYNVTGPTGPTGSMGYDGNITFVVIDMPGYTGERGIRGKTGPTGITGYDATATGHIDFSGYTGQRGSPANCESACVVCSCQHFVNFAGMIDAILTVSDFRVSSNSLIVEYEQAKVGLRQWSHGLEAYITQREIKTIVLPGRDYEGCEEL